MGHKPGLLQGGIAMSNSILMGMASTLFTLLPFFAVSTFAAGDPPDSITIDQLSNFYQPVEFEHGIHLESYSCARCHHHAAGEPDSDTLCAKCHQNENKGLPLDCGACHASGGQPVVETDSNGYHIDTPDLKGAYHLQCSGCHQQDSGPVGCTDCHGLTTAGEKFLKVRKD